MANTTVIHIRHWNKADANQVFIGRPSPWGNPFVIGKDGTREEVVAKYRAWIVAGDTTNKVKTLRGKTLVCFCKPLACHGDVLAQLADSDK